MHMLGKLTLFAPPISRRRIVKLGVIMLCFLALIGCGDELTTQVIATVTPENTLVLEPTKVSAGPLVPVGQPGDDWTLIFSDEFESSSLDDSKWSTCYWWDDNGCTITSNNELQWYMPHNVMVEDGMLRLRAQEETIDASNGTTYHYTSGVITTGPPNYKTDPAKFAFRYGYAEIRAKVPSGQGLWPAFWLLPDDFTSKPEIDVLEILGHQTNVLNMAFHYLDSDEERQRGAFKWTGPDFAQDWHVYAVDWTPQSMVWYIDGVERWRFDELEYVPATTLYLLLNLAVGGDWPGAPDSSTEFPAYYEVDYVRVWQRDSTVQQTIQETPVAVGPDLSVTPVGRQGDWTLVFDDEFESTALDESKWSTCYWWDDNGCTNEGSGDLQWYTPDNIVLEDGILHLRAQEQTVDASNENTYNYTSGMITTGPPNYKTDPAKFTFRYGYIEVRAQVPRGEGLLSAFWLLPDDFTSKPSIDGSIVLGNAPDTMHMAVYYLDKAETSQEALETWTGPDLSDDWHVYGLEWTEGALIWYVDGVEHWRFDELENVPATALYMLFNLTVGGDRPGSPATTAFPIDYAIDYVRVWQRAGL